MILSSSARPKPHNITTGFSLVELLVVMVIVSATTALLVSGFSITWKNFSKLSQRDLLMNSNLMGERWLRDSISEAVLFHPDDANFVGEPNSIRFTSISVPWRSEQIPEEVTWSLVNTEQGTQLQITTGQTQTSLITYPARSQFEYLHQNNWNSRFVPEDAQLPAAVRVVHNGQVVFFAATKRPGKAEMPPEMITFGKYEFGS